MVTKHKGVISNQNYLSYIEQNILEFIKVRALQALPIAFPVGSNTDLEQYSSRVNSAFPATTIEIAVKAELAIGTVSDILQKLRRSKKIKVRNFKWFTKEKKFYIPYDMTWPDYMEKTCNICENWNRFTRSCTFYQELATDGYRVDKERLKKKIPPELTACKWYMERITRALQTFSSLQNFAEETCDLEVWWQKEKQDEHYLFVPKVPMQAYKCHFCKKPIPQLGWGSLPLIGSAIVSCNYCGSFYKLIMDKKLEEYTVIASEEKYHEYAKRYYIFTGRELPKPNYTSSEYGFSIYEFNEETDLHDEIETFTNKNIFAFYNQLKFLVVRKKEYQSILQQRLGEEHPQIRIMFAEEPPKSVEPTKQQKGAVGLLREYGPANYDYSIDLLWSKMTTLEEIEELVNKRKLMKAQEEIIKPIFELQRLEKKGQKLTSERWNILDGLAAKAMWEVIKPVVESHGFGMPNRSRARHVENDRLRPYGLYPSYSRGNTIFNGALRKITNVFIEKCNKYQFPWEGLEGICHKKTSGGIYGFLLDNSEGIKQTAIPTTLKTIAEGRITPEMVKTVRMRKRMEIAYIKQDSQANHELDKDTEKLTKMKVVAVIHGEEKKTTLSKAIEYQVQSLKKLLEDIVWLDDTTIIIDGTKYTPWAVAAENRWDEVTEKQRLKMGCSLKKIIEQAKSYFTPFRFQLEFSRERFSLD